jgi:hypothetical protein
MIEERLPFCINELAEVVGMTDTDKLKELSSATAKASLPGMINKLDKRQTVNLRKVVIKVVLNLATTKLTTNQIK